MSMTEVFENSTFNYKTSSFANNQWSRLFNEKNQRKTSAESVDTVTTTDSMSDAQKNFSPSSNSSRNYLEDSQDEALAIFNSAIKPKRKVVADETKYKTEMCKNWAETNKCPYGRKCKFAHGKEELNEKLLGNKRHYKSKKCNSFHSNMICPYGSRCLFAHEQRTLEELQSNPYEKFLAFPSLMKKVRLPSFISAISEEEEAISTVSTQYMMDEFNEEFNQILKITCQ